MKLVSTREIPQPQRAELHRAAPALEIVVVPQQEWDRLLTEVADADVIMGGFGGGSGEVFRAIVGAAKKVRWIHTSSAGVDEIVFPELFERGIALTCGKGSGMVSPQADHAMGLLLALCRQIVKAARQESWQYAKFRSNVTDLEGMTMGIVGFGAVGHALAERATAFGMRVLAIRRHPEPAPAGVEALWGPDRLPDLLASSDVVVLVLPNTPETYQSFGETELRQMKPTALLINVGRGQVMDGQAIERALTEGWIAGAGLDVMPEEPWPADSPLWHLDNVLITPHYAGVGPRIGDRNVELFVDNLRRFLRGEPLASEVSGEDGY